MRNIVKLPTVLVALITAQMNTIARLLQRYLKRCFGA